MTHSTLNLKVPKKTVSVELALVGREVKTAEVFLAEYHASSWRHQNVLDLLEDDKAFLPAQFNDQDGRLLFNPGSASQQISPNIPPSLGLLRVHPGGSVQGEIVFLARRNSPKRSRKWLPSP